MTTNPLFHEVYGIYFSIVTTILNSQQSLSLKELDIIVRSKGFDESHLQLMPSLLNQKNPWHLLKEGKDQKWVPLTQQPTPPFQTDLERQWLKGIISDPRLLNFMNQYEIEDWDKQLNAVSPLFKMTDIIHFDQFKQQENLVEQSQQRNHFKRLLLAIKQQEFLKIEYQRHEQATAKTGIFWPISLEYSEKNHLFRLKAWRVLRKSRFEVTLNLNRMVTIQATPTHQNIEGKAITSRRRVEQVTCQLIDKRDALNRSMLHFADYQKTTKRLANGDHYELTIHYDSSDETELLIRLLSFGPFIKVTSPNHFVAKINERLTAQLALMTESYKKTD